MKKRRKNLTAETKLHETAQKLLQQTKRVGIDPTVVRLLWVLFSLMGGCGILAYIIAAIIIPRNPVC